MVVWQIFLVYIVYILINQMMTIHKMNFVHHFSVTCLVSFQVSLYIFLTYSTFTLIQWLTSVSTSHDAAADVEEMKLDPNFFTNAFKSHPAL